MDDILTSIRRIIQEDESRGPDAPAKPVAATAVADGTSANGSRPANATQRPDDVLLLTDLVDDPEAARTPPDAAAPVRPAATNPISSAMDRLARAVEAASPPVTAPAEPASAAVGGRTLEDVVKDALRPMLQEWIDKNLPTLVERIVEREVQRLTQR